MNAIHCMWFNIVKIFAKITASNTIERTNVTHDKKRYTKLCFSMNNFDSNRKI